jgi:hypothetical protein
LETIIAFYSDYIPNRREMQGKIVGAFIVLENVIAKFSGTVIFAWVLTQLCIIYMSDLSYFATIRHPWGEKPCEERASQA